MRKNVFNQIKTIFNPKSHTEVKNIHNGFKLFSDLHTRVANEIISTYSDKNKRAGLKQSGYVYIVDPDAANSIASYISKDWNDGYILEANPGPGILSSYLLKNGVKSLRVFEKNKEFLPALEALSMFYPNLEVAEEDLMFLPTLEFKTSYGDSNFLETFFQNIPELEWNDEISFRVFSIIASKRSKKFLRYLLAILPTKSSIFAFGRCEFFLLTTETEFLYMKAVPKENFAMYRWSTVLYNLFFEIKCLKKFSSESLFPLNSAYYRKKAKSGSNTFYLIQLTPRIDIFSDIVNQNKLTDFYFFVRHHLVKRRALVIPTLEGWIPLCGPRLIKEGMNVFTKFGDLSPNQILLLFNQFSSWPEYDDSAFQAAASRYYGKDRLPYEDDDPPEQ